MELILEQALSRLQALSGWSRGLQSYYVNLLQHEEPVLRVAAATVLLNHQGLPLSQWPALVPLAEYGAVRNRAVSYFTQLAEYEWAEKILAQPSKFDRQAVLDEYNREQLMPRRKKSAELARKLFLADGAFEWLAKAQQAQEAEGGWRNGLESLVEYILSLPTDPEGPFTLLDTLANANRYDLVEKIVAIFKDARVYPMECAVFQAKAYEKKGKFKEAIDTLPEDTRGIISDSLMEAYWDTRALAKRGLRKFQQAFRCYQEKNKVNVPKHIEPERFYREHQALAALTFEQDERLHQRGNVFMMLGFPRSGTTLLENALASHPAIETFEEIPSLKAVEHHLFRLGKTSVSAPEQDEARAVYGRVLDRFKQKPGASVFIDKLPIRSAQAKLLSQLLPDQKYIFSIRHPHDVVLSCLFQSFAHNTAMENFRTLAQACRIYDFTMSQWFGVFSLNSPQVHYVRYDDVVTDFERTVTDACQFVGVSWDPKVLEFSERAQQRPIRTPSYAKVREGLSIGVQSYWKDFGFLFERAETKCLLRWVKHFGYDS